MPARTFLCLALLSATGAMPASSGFILGPDYSEWVVPRVTRIATDSTGALYILSTCQVNGSSFSSCVTKLSADGKTILWQNNLGFAIGYSGNAMAVDPTGGVYVIPMYQPGDTSVFVAKLSAGGTGLAWKTPVTVGLIGNPSLTADSQGRTYVAGLIGPADNLSNVVVRLNAAGSAVDYTAQAPGYLVSIAVDRSGAAFLTGSTGVPFLARLAPDGSAGFFTPLPATNSAGLVALDSNGNAVVYSQAADGSGVVQHFDSTGAVTLTSPTVGGGSNFVLDAAGNGYVTGSSYIYASGLAYLLPVRNSLGTCGSQWLSMFAPDGSLLQTTYIPGGTFNVNLPFIAIGANSNVFVVAYADASFAPTQTGPFPAGTSATNPVPAFLWRLSPNAFAQTSPLACLGNAATYQTGPIAPGGYVTLFGSGLGPRQGVQTQATLQSPFPSQAANVEVTFDGTPAPLLWVQDAQINVIAPWSLTPGKATQVCVSYNSVPTNCLTWPVTQTAPAVFTVDGVYAAALNQDGSVNSAHNPAAVGSIISVFATGLGPIAPPQADGTLVGFPLPNNVLPVTVEAVMIEPPSGFPFVTDFDVTYAGPAPYLVAGTSQINFQVVNYTGSISAGRSQFFQIYVAGK